MTTDELHERLREAEATLLTALRTLAEVGDAEAPCSSADMGAKHVAPLAELQRAHQRFERLSRMLDEFGASTH